MTETAFGGQATKTQSGANLSTPPSRSPARAILLSLSALIVGVVCWGVWAEIQNDRDAALEEAQRRARLTVDAAAMQAALLFRQADTAAAAAAAAAETALRRTGSLQGAPTAETLRDLIVRATGGAATPLNNVAVTGADGKIVADSADAALGMSFAEREFFAAHRRSSPSASATIPPFISAPMRSRLIDGWCVVVSRRVDGPDGGFAGVAFAAIDLTKLEESFGALDVGQDGFVALWRGDGKILAHAPRDARWMDGVFADFADAASGSRADAGNAEWPRRTLADGVARRLTMRGVEGAPLAVAVGFADKEILRQWARTTPEKAAVAVAVVALTAALSIVLLAYLRRLDAADAALRASERRTRALFDSAFEYIALLSVGGAVISANHGLIRLARDEAGEAAAVPAVDFAADAAPDGGAGDGGAVESDLVGCAFWGLAPWRYSPMSVWRIRDAVCRAARGEFVRFECDVRAAGETRTMDVSIKPIGDDHAGVGSLIAEARDVTDRKLGEDSLRAGEARIRSYFEAAMDGIVVVGQDGRFIDANPAACRMFGLQRRVLTLLNFADILPAVGAAASSHLAQVNALGSYRGELRFKRSDGEIRTAEVSAVRLEGDNYLGVFRDVTRQRFEAEAQRAGNARIAALLRAIPDMVMLMDRSGLYLELVTPPDDDRLMVAAHRLLGRRPADILPPEIAENILTAARAAADAVQAGRLQVGTVEFPLDLTDGVRWFEARFSAMAGIADDEGGRVLQITRDVTERVEAAARLADAKEQAEAANRTKSAFLATMSHELRTPLNAIIGFSEIMRTEMFGPVGNARYAGYVDNIFESGGHLLSLINDVLDISKLEAGKYVLEESWVDAAELVESCCALTDAAAAVGGLKLERDVAANMPPVYCDERAFRQVLLNLLSNAVKFTPPGGRVAVTINREDDDGLAVAIADTGIGIPPDALSRIAQPFQQVDNSISRRFGGTGLGLAISRNLMELHGGRLDIQSVAGEGATVKAVFPPTRVAGGEETIGLIG